MERAASAPRPSGRIRLSAEGLIEEHLALSSAGQGGTKGASAEDTRTLADLGASVMKAVHKGSWHPPETIAEEAEPVDEGGPARTEFEPTELPELSDPRPSRRSAAIVLLALLLLGGGFGLFRFAPGDSTPSQGSGTTAGTVASPPNGELPSAVSGAPSPGDQSLQATLAAPASTPLPTTAPEPEPTLAPAASPTSAPALEPTAAPGPTVAPVVNAVHVGDLVPHVKQGGVKAKVSVRVYVHDSAHNPMVGASVTGQWDGASGSTSCVASADSSCVVETAPLSVPGGVTFTVTAVTYEGAPYEPDLNHDADGDSNGTSVTVTF